MLVENIFTEYIQSFVLELSWFNGELETKQNVQRCNIEESIVNVDAWREAVAATNDVTDKHPLPYLHIKAAETNC